MHTLKIKNLHVKADGKEIIKGLNLTLKEGETHVIMGPNGVGKSTLLNVIMGNPNYKIKEGSIFYDDIDITKKTPEQRAKLGIFLAFQTPVELEGVMTIDFLRSIKQQQGHVNLFQFSKELKEILKKLNLDESFLKREVNKNFSGGEKKKMEIVTMHLLKPTFLLLDEIDSGLDIDSIKQIGKEVSDYQKEVSASILMVTHYDKMIEKIKPTHAHIMKDGKIEKEGNINLVEEILKEGYEKI